MTQEECINKTECPVAFVLIENLNAIYQNCKEMERVISENVNTKREIKETAAKLRRNCEAIKGNAVKDWLERHRWIRAETPTYEVDAQRDGNWGKMDVACQTDNIENGNQWVNLSIIDTAEKFEEVAKVEWSEEMYQNTEITVGNPLNDNECTKVVFREPDDKHMDKSIQKLFKERYPKLREIKNDIGIIERETKIRNTEGSRQLRQKVVLLEIDGTTKDLWEKMTQLKEETVNEEVIEIHQIRCIPLKTLGKMTECIFHKTKVNIYTNDKGGNETKKKVNRNTYALIVNTNKQEYEQTLRTVKQTITTESGGAIRVSEALRMEN